MGSLNGFWGTCLLEHAPKTPSSCVAGEEVTAEEAAGSVRNPGHSARCCSSLVRLHLRLCAAGTSPQLMLLAGSRCSTKKWDEARVPPCKAGGWRQIEVLQSHPCFRQQCRGLQGHCSWSAWISLLRDTRPECHPAPSCQPRARSLQAHQEATGRRTSSQCAHGDLA